VSGARPDLVFAAGGVSYTEEPHAFFSFRK
jgi:hypothetical protein